MKIRHVTGNGNLQNENGDLRNKPLFSRIIIISEIVEHLPGLSVGIGQATDRQPTTHNDLQIIQ